MRLPADSLKPQLASLAGAGCSTGLFVSADELYLHSTSDKHGAQYWVTLRADDEREHFTASIDLAELKAAISTPCKEIELNQAGDVIEVRAGRLRSRLATVSSQAVKIPNQFPNALRNRVVRVLSDHGPMLKTNAQGAPAVPITIAASKRGFCVGVAYDFLAIVISSGDVSFESPLVLSPVTMNCMLQAVSAGATNLGFDATGATAWGASLVAKFPMTEAEPGRATLEQVVAWFSPTDMRIDTKELKQALDPLLQADTDTITLKFGEKPRATVTAKSGSASSTPLPLASGKPASAIVRIDMLTEALKRCRGETVALFPVSKGKDVIGVDLHGSVGDATVFQRLGVLS